MRLTAVQAGAYLHHIHLLSENPDEVVSFYSDAMDMPDVEKIGDTLLCKGPRRRLLVSRGPSQTLAHCAFACRDAISLDDILQRAAAEGLSPVPFSNPLMKEGAFSVRDPDGNQVVFGLAVEDEPVTAPGMKGPLQHLTLATTNVAAIEDFYFGKLGFGVSDRIKNDDGELVGCFMRSNHEHHTLACFLNKTRAGIDHHSYEAGDFMTIRDWCDRFSARGIKLIWGPGRHGPGNNIFIFIVDPDNNWIEVSAELEVVYNRGTAEWRRDERGANLWGDGMARLTRGVAAK